MTPSLLLFASVLSTPQVPDRLIRLQGHVHLAEFPDQRVQDASLSGDAHGLIGDNEPVLPELVSQVQGRLDHVPADEAPRPRG